MAVAAGSETRGSPCQAECKYGPHQSQPGSLPPASLPALPSTVTETAEGSAVHDNRAVFSSDHKPCLVRRENDHAVGGEVKEDFPVQGRTGNPSKLEKAHS